MGTKAVKVSLVVEVDNQRLGEFPLVRRLDAGQYAAFELSVPPSTGVQPSTLLPPVVGVKKIAVFRADKHVDVSAVGNSETVLAFSLNPGGFICIVDGTLGNLTAANPDAVETLTLDEILAGDPS